MITKELGKFITFLSALPLSHAILMPAGGHLAAPCILADRIEKPCRQRTRGSPGAIRTRPPQPPRKVGISFSEDDESPRLGTSPATCKAVLMARCRSSCRRDVRLAAWHMFVVEHSIQPSCMMSPLVNRGSNCFDNATKGGPSRYVAYTFRSHTFPKAQTKNLKNNALANKLCCMLGALVVRADSQDIQHVCAASAGFQKGLGRCAQAHTAR